MIRDSSNDFPLQKRFNSWRFLKMYWGSKETGGGTLSTTGWSKWGRNVASGWLCVGHAEIADLGLYYFYFHRWRWGVDHGFQLACRCCESSFLSEFLMNSLSVRKCLPCYAFRRKQKAEADKRISTQQPSVHSRMQWLQVIQLIGGEVYFINDACPRQFCQSFVKSRLLTAFYMAAGEIRHYIHPQHGCKTRDVDALTRAKNGKCQVPSLIDFVHAFSFFSFSTDKKTDGKKPEKAVWNFNSLGLFLGTFEVVETFVWSLERFVVDQGIDDLSWHQSP